MFVLMCINNINRLICSQLTFRQYMVGFSANLVCLNIDWTDELRQPSWQLRSSYNQRSLYIEYTHVENVSASINIDGIAFTLLKFHRYGMYLYSYTYRVALIEGYASLNDFHVKCIIRLWLLPYIQAISIQDQSLNTQISFQFITHNYSLNQNI